MENINKILEVLNKALEEKDAEIGYLKYRVAQAEKRLEALTRLRIEPTKESEQE